jgi:hypothetical protein
MTAATLRNRSYANQEYEPYSQPYILFQADPPGDISPGECVARDAPILDTCP